MTANVGRRLTQIERQAAAKALRRHGVSDQKSIGLWLDADCYMPLDEHIDALVAWAQAFPAAEWGRLWYDSALVREEALEWSAAGFSPSQAEELTLTLLGRARTCDPETLLRVERAWRESGLPAKWVLMCVRYGIDDMRTARIMFDASKGMRSA